MSSVFPPGLQLGTRYRVLRLIEDNRIGALFEAECLTTHERVALKWLRFSAPRAPQLAQQFAERARAASRLRHPNRAHIQAVTLEGNAVFVVSDLLSGESLRARLAPHEMLMHERLHVLAQAMRAVVDAHGRGLVHGGLHPGNIFLQREHDAWLGLPALTKVLDFGTSTHGLLESLARPTDWSELGAHAFLDYQQLSADSDRDPRSDVYAFGVLLYHALTGHMPYPAKSPLELALKQATTTATRARVLHAALPPLLDELIAACLLRTRSERPPLAQLAAETSAYAAQCSSREVLEAVGPNTRPMNLPRQAAEAPLAGGHAMTGRTTIKLNRWDILSLLKEQARVQAQALAEPVREESVQANEPSVRERAQASERRGEQGSRPLQQAPDSAAPSLSATTLHAPLGLPPTGPVGSVRETVSSHQDPHERARSVARNRPTSRGRSWAQAGLLLLVLAGVAFAARVQLVGGSDFSRPPPQLPAHPYPRAAAPPLDERVAPRQVTVSAAVDDPADDGQGLVVTVAADSGPKRVAVRRAEPRPARLVSAHVARVPPPHHDDSYLVGTPPSEDEF